MKDQQHSFGITFITLLCGAILGLGIGMGIIDLYVYAKDKPGSSNPWGLESDPAMGLVLANCGNCHTPYLITHHRRSREDWEKTITKMVSNGMTAPPDLVRTMLLDYLEKHQGPTDVQRPVASPWGHSSFDANPLW